MNAPVQPAPVAAAAHGAVAALGAGWRQYALALGTTVLCTGLSALMYPWLDRANLVMVYLLGTTVSALWLGRGPAALSAVVNVLVFDFFFVPPHFTLAVADIQYLLTFAVMLLVALTIATLVAAVRRQTRATDEARFAAEREALRNTLLGSISHDLRTPLAVIAGASSALADPSTELDAASRARLAASIELKAQEMSSLIANVLNLMRFESGAMRLRRDWQTIDDLVGTALGRVGAALKDHSVRVALPPDLPALQLDGPLITQVLCNLLENGARHTPPGATLTISADADHGQLQVHVTDNGPGLPPGDRERLFGKFNHGREESNSGGAGLGLAICRAIIRAHGGEIHAADVPGGGARFTFSLPSGDAAS